MNASWAGKGCEGPATICSRNHPHPEVTGHSPVTALCLQEVEGWAPTAFHCQRGYLMRGLSFPRQDTKDTSSVSLGTIESLTF